MSVSSIGQGPVSPVNTNGQIQTNGQVQGGKSQQFQTAGNNAPSSNNTTRPTGTQPLNSSGRGQVVNLVV